MPIVDILSEVEILNLFAMTKHPGFPTLEKICMTLCETVNKELLRLDPGSEGYERKLAALHNKAQVYNEFSSLILKTCFWQEELNKTKENLELPKQKPEDETPATVISGENPILKRIIKNYDRPINRSAA